LVTDLSDRHGRPASDPLASVRRESRASVRHRADLRFRGGGWDWFVSTRGPCVNGSPVGVDKDAGIRRPPRRLGRLALEERVEAGLILRDEPRLEDLSTTDVEDLDGLALEGLAASPGHEAIDPLSFLMARRDLPLPDPAELEDLARPVPGW
jgi:hypothetical protein